MLEKYGFVYLWYDKKLKRYYIGCRWGFEDDGYICSSTWMKSAFLRRPSDFKRKILSRIYTNKKDLLKEEYKFLCRIKQHELGKKYYNLNNHHFGHWSSDEASSLSVREKMAKAKLGKILKPHSEETKNKISYSNRGKFVSDETKTKLSISHKGHKLSAETIRKRTETRKQNCKSKPHSEETKKKISETLKRKNRMSNVTINELLATGIVNFRYTKIDGSIRKAVGTTNMDLIPEDERPASIVIPAEADTSYVRYFDTGVGEWRAFVKANLMEFAPAE